ncbi:interleukin-20 receptor subunit alpha-like [Pimephales promelas]|uniref:interleukin-20 receptor subunit alpha-like n=1 Tax=Pimephales promelas TaxID=90988 RepID=UPI0019558E59|nr:interleukin-20 receptor subunit alpha-like [Pimephales promelas]
METVLVIALCLLSRAATASVERLPEPGNVHFTSVNLRNIVKWTPGEGSPNDTVFSVEYAKYGEEETIGSGRLRWRRVKQCRSITHTECDVSQETSDLHEQYYARVRAVSAHTHSLWSESTHRFDPFLDTVIGPPHVEVNLLHNYMNVTIKGPFRWRTKRTKEDSSLMEIFSEMIYDLSVFNSRSNHTNHMHLTNGSVRLGPLDFSTRFCLVVYAKSKTLPLDYKPSEQLCVETPKDPFRDQLLAAMLGGVLPSALCLCVLAVLGGLIHCYITDHRQTLPKSAHVARLSDKLQTFQPEMPSTIIINVLKMGRFEDEWSALCPPALPQPVSAEDSSAAQAQALNAVPEPPVSYALQHEPPPAGSGALQEDEDEDSGREDAELEPWPQEPPHSEAGDYGIVLPAGFHAPGRCPAELSPYRAQGVTVDPSEPEDACEDECEDEQNDEEVEAQIFLDWSPVTRELTIPLMGLLGLEDEPQIQTEAVSLLPNVVLRQSSQEGAEQDDDFTKMERNWGLIIHSNPE